MINNKSERGQIQISFPFQCDELLSLTVMAYLLRNKRNPHYSALTFITLGSFGGLTYVKNTFFKKRFCFLLEQNTPVDIPFCHLYCSEMA